MTFKGFNDSKRLLDRSQNFKKLKGETKTDSYVTRTVEKKHPIMVSIYL